MENSTREILKEIARWLKEGRHSINVTNLEGSQWVGITQ